MKETSSYLRNRWENELKPVADSVMHEFIRRGDIAKLDLPKTKEGLIDLRGFSAPKKYKIEKSNSGRDITYVFEGISIKKIDFVSIDFSYADFERCEFFSCIFKGSKFDDARFIATDFYDCKFHEIEFFKTNFSQSSFQTGDLIFKRIKENFKDITFNYCHPSKF